MGRIFLGDSGLVAGSKTFWDLLNTCSFFKFQERLESLKNPWKAARTVDKHHIPIFGKFPALKDNGANF